jgi:hypothetical protein
MRWVFFSYTLPSRPSRARVYIWRRLRKMGAVNCQSLWVLPHSGDRLRELGKLTEEIQSWKGEALLIEGRLLNPEAEDSIREAFVASREEEYREIISKCADYAKEIEFEITRQNFIFAEVEENEEELEKLKQWLDKVQKRDIVGAPSQQQAVEKVAQCEELFHDFALRVYEHTQTKARERRKKRKVSSAERAGQDRLRNVSE